GISSRYCWFWSVGRLSSTAFMPKSDYSLSIADGEVTLPRSALAFSLVFGEGVASTTPGLIVFSKSRGFAEIIAPGADDRRCGRGYAPLKEENSPAPRRCWLARSRCSQAGDRSVMEEYDLTAENSRPDRILEWL